MAQLKLRQKLLALIVVVGGIGLTAFVLMLVLAEQHLFERFVPENRALRDVESRSALLIQNYYRFMLTPEIISQDELDSSLVLIRQGLDQYRQLVSGQKQKEEFSASILKSLDGLELAGREMVVARESFEQIFARQEGLELEIDLVFKQYLEEVSVDIGHSIEDENWQALSRNYLPELRMIETINQQLLSLFLEIRGYQIAPNEDAVDRINRLQEHIKSSTSLLEIYVANSNARSKNANDILMVFEKMTTVVGNLTRSRKTAEFAVSRAEQSGIDLNQAIVAAIVVADTDGLKKLRETLLLSGGILLFTLVVSYLLLYTGLNRIVSPLEKLQSIIRRLGRGDWHQRADFHREDEIGKLADTFNQMADRLEGDALEKQELIDQLEQKNTELERFTYTVSHELKSPLVTVNGFLGLLEKDLAANHAERVRDDMNKISLAVDVMSEQLDDLLELSRMGQTVTQASAFSLSGLCRDVVEIMQGLIIDRKVVVEIDEEMPLVVADQARIRLVLKNLVENAIKFVAENKQPRITISAERHQGRVLCRVTDNGPGIEPRYRERVFGLFERLDSEISGTGVGLALVKRIIEIHNGKVWIESQGDGQGCCFCFTLPLREEPEV